MGIFLCLCLWHRTALHTMLTAFFFFNRPASISVRSHISKVSLVTLFHAFFPSSYFICLFFFFFNAQGYFIGIADCWKRAHKKKWLSIAPVSLDVCCSTDGDNKKKSLKSWEQTSKHTNKQTHTHQRKEKKKENRRSKARLRQFQAMRAGVNSFLFVCL